MSDPRALRDIDRRMGQTEVGERAWRNYGTAIPAGYPNNVPFFRTDLGWWIYYDGTRQLTAQEYPIALVPVTAYTAAGSPNATPAVEIRTDYAPYITRVATTLVVLVTNNATNYWTIDVLGVNLAFSATTTIASYDSKLDTVNVRTLHEGAPSAFSTFDATPANRQYVRCRLTKTLAPGDVEFSATVYARLIIP